MTKAVNHNSAELPSEDANLLADCFQAISEKASIISTIFRKNSIPFTSVNGISQHTHQDEPQTPEKKKPKKKVKADPNKPKKPLTSFLLFCNDNRSKVAESNPGLAPNDVTRALGESWQALSKEEQESYIARYKKAAVIYNKDLEEYHNTPKPQDTTELVPLSSEVPKKSPARNSKAEKPVSQPKSQNKADKPTKPQDKPVNQPKSQDKVEKTANQLKPQDKAEKAKHIKPTKKSKKKHIKPEPKVVKDASVNPILEPLNETSTGLSKKRKREKKNNN